MPYNAPEVVVFGPLKHCTPLKNTEKAGKQMKQRQATPAPPLSSHKRTPSNLGLSNENSGGNPLAQILCHYTNQWNSVLNPLLKCL